MSRVLIALLVIAMSAPAGAALVPYEAVDGSAGTARGNNLVDVTATNACGFTIVAGNINLTGCRDRNGVLCPTNAACDLDRVPAGRCTLGNNAACLWPNGAGFCTADGNVGCLVNLDCTNKGLAGTCDTSQCPGGDCSGCACQGTDDTLATFETNAGRCGGTIGVCSDGDSEFAYAPSISGGLCFNLVAPTDRPFNCGLEAGQALTGARSSFENPPISPSLQRESPAGPIVELRTTQVYDIGALEPGRGSIRRFSLLADSYWEDPTWSDKTLTGAAANAHIWTLWCDTPTGWSTDDNLPNGQSCWNSTANSIGYIWTQDVPANDFLPAGSLTTNLDVDMNGVADCPPHCGLNYDLHTLEQLALEAVLRLDVRAGAQLALESFVDGPAGAGDLVAVASVVSHVWLPAIDQRCWMGGDPEAICSTCVGGLCSGYLALSCTVGRDCALYTGRCSDSEQPCNPAGAGTACPGAQLCRSCVGVFASGLCVGIGGACRLDSDCANNNCGDQNGNNIYPEPTAHNPLAIPVGYNTYGFAELELETRCNPTRPGRLGLVTHFGRALAAPLALLVTTGAAATEVRDPDLGGAPAPNDTGALGLVSGAAVGIAAWGGYPLENGSYAVGTVFPVDPTGPPCCAATGNVTGVLDKATESVRPVITENAGAITWPEGSAGSVQTAPLRTSGWGGGANRTPGCPGDSSLVGAPAPDPGPCNDPLGGSSFCTGGDCEGNTGADDVRTTATIGGVANVPALNARAKVPDRFATGTSAPTLYGVATFTGLDVDVLSPSDTDFSAAVELLHCPMIGACSEAPTQDCIRDADCGAGNTCLNRVKRCVTLEPDCEDPDMDGVYVCAGGDNCPDRFNPDQANFEGDALGDACDACETVVNAGVDTDMDGVDNACDTCTNQGNPQLAGTPVLNRTFVSHQRDDDADGRGNRCDFDYNNTGVAITAGDFNDMKFSLLPSSGFTALNTCGATTAEGGSGATQPCGEFDHDGMGSTVSAGDFNLSKAAVAAGGVINTNFPKCTACTVGTGWSNVIGPGARLGRPVCQTAVPGRCVFAP